MDILKLNTSSIKGKMVGDWLIEEIQEQPIAYVLYLSKNTTDKVFFVRKPVIKAESLNLPNDVYELWYDDYKDATLLSLSDALNPDTLVEAIRLLIDKYSKFD